MPDDIMSFFDDPADSGTSTTESTTETATTQTDPAATQTASTQAGVTPEQFAAMQQELESAKRWRQDVGRMMLGVNPDQQTQQQVDPQQFIQQFFTNPTEVMQQTAQQAAAMARQELQNNAIMDDRRAKNPDIAKVEHLVDWNSAMTAAAQQFYNQHKRAPSFAEALDGSIAMVRQNFQGQQPGTQTQQGGQGNRMALNLDLGGSQPTSSAPVDPFSISDADWPKHRDALMRKQQGF